MTEPQTTTITPEIVRDTIQAPYRFNDDEKLALSDRLVEALRNRDQIDRELESCKEEFKARTKKAELEVDNLRGKLGNGFEMRPTLAIVNFNTPTQGRKQFVNEETGEIIRDEPMSVADLERPLFRTVNGGDATAPEPEDEPDTATIPDGANVTSPGAEAAGTVNLGDKLGEATAKTTVAQLPIGLEEPGWTASGLRSEVRTKAKLAKWPETSIRLLLDVIDGCSGDLTKIKESIRPHVAVPSED